MDTGTVRSYLKAAKFQNLYTQIAFIAHMFLVIISLK